MKPLKGSRFSIRPKNQTILAMEESFIGSRAMHMDTHVWVFMGKRAMNPSAVFTSKERAMEWITRLNLNGTLTAYPLDVPVYDWAIEKKVFTPTKDYQREAKFIAGFSSASLEHYHFDDDPT